MAASPGRSVPRCLLLTGTVGSGKTTTAHAVGEALRLRGVPHVIVDLDELARMWPAPPDDPFREALGRANLAAVAANGIAAGATTLVLAGVVEGPAGVAAVAEAVGVPLVVCRLRVPIDRVRKRLITRHEAGAARDWHLVRSVELDEILNRELQADHVITVGEDDATAVAHEVLNEVGW